MLQKLIKRFNQYIYIYINRNKIILEQKDRKTEKKTVNLHYWSNAAESGGEENLGDYLSVVIVEWMKKRCGIQEYKQAKTKHLYAIGSIIGVGLANATVWGSGFLAEPPRRSIWFFVKRKLQKLDIRAVRGPLSRNAVQRIWKNVDCPEIYGDPAMLLPLVYSPHTCVPTKDYVVVRHFCDEKQEADINILTKDYRRFVDQLLAGKKVISSSLHGIIIAESYGIPSVLLLSGCVKEQWFKFQDYYLGTGRATFPVAQSLEEAIQMAPCELPDVQAIQERLLASFPVDLWN